MPAPPFAKGGGSTVKNMYYVYIIKSKKDQKFYIGCTGNLKNRLTEHNSGKVEATKYRKPFDLIYYEAYGSKEQAFDREQKLKVFGSAYTGLIKRLQLK
jgi:putative endonuclease